MATRAHNFKNLTGGQFGRLTVIREALKRRGFVHWECLCSCGVVKSVGSAPLLRGKTLSCGCLKAEQNIARSTTHGWSRTSLYKIWVGMKKRCENPKCISFERYGGRGITVCARWQKFENFLNDMGERPSKKHSIERINNNGNYSPSNCKWATKKEQSENRRNARMITFNGRTQNIKTWAMELGINHKNLHHRLERGWPVEKALTGLKRSRTIGLLAKKHGIPYRTLWRRLRDGWPLEKVTMPHTPTRKF